MEPDPPLETLRTLVLDAAWRPMRAIGWERAMCLGLADRVDVLEYYGRLVRSATDVFPLPAVIKARRFVARAPARVALTRKNLLVRDSGRCQYCGVRPGTSHLTLDHVVPRSRGGRTTWQNLVACCAECNRRKADRTPNEAGMPLLSRPRVPSAVELGRDGLALTDPPNEWLQYLPTGLSRSGC